MFYWQAPINGTPRIKSLADIVIENEINFKMNFKPDFLNLALVLV